MQGPYPHGVLLGRQTNKRTKFQIDISVMAVISTIRECTRGWQWPVYLPSWYLGSPLKQANLSCSLTEGRDPITGRAQGDVCQGEGKTTGPKEGKYRGSQCCWLISNSGLHSRGEGQRVMALESREGTRASRRVEEGLSCLSRGEIGRAHV